MSYNKIFIGGMKKLIFFENSLKGRGTLVQIRFFLMLPILALGGGGI